MQYLDESVEEAAQHVIDDLFRDGGLGAVVAMDRQGNVALARNCDRMYRGIIRAKDTSTLRFTFACPRSPLT
ncbi:hypothetical protein OG21DRAFT_739821 [Imleria badia]|nr:hypothetical protein OG21DRAFT_739821 [Imleria badia]